MTNKTLEYYEQNASTFVANTVGVDFKDVQDAFLNLLEPGNLVLDFGCGSGRDTKYFLEHGLKVEAMDGSKELCALARLHTGIDVHHALFSDLDETEKYDGIWACASILHLSKEELVPVMEKMVRAVKPGGIIYTSFKYGDFEGMRNGRYFTDFTEESFVRFLSKIHGVSVLKMWISGDARKDRGEEKWLNILLQK